MYCSNCGQENTDGSKFCCNCGNKLESVPNTNRKISIQKESPINQGENNTSNTVTAIIKLIASIAVLYYCGSSLFSGVFSNDLVTTTSTRSSTSIVSNVPTEHRNALKSAEFFAKDMHMSKKAIYDQLTSQHGGKFPPDAANYAINNLNVDYNANALKSAQFYYNELHMSKQRVYKQLCSPHGAKFTEAEADYAVKNLR